MRLRILSFPAYGWTYSATYIYLNILLYSLCIEVIKRVAINLDHLDNERKITVIIVDQFSLGVVIRHN